VDVPKEGVPLGNDEQEGGEQLAALQDIEKIW
jgi:hypothetical protein